MRTRTELSELCTIVLVLAGYSASPAAADDSVSVPVDPGTLARQGDLDATACGPISVVNALALGDAACRRALADLRGDSNVRRAEDLLERFASRPSRDYGEGTRRRRDGISCADLADLLGEAVAQSGLKATGQFLDRRPNEADGAYLRRVHGLLSQALRERRPPIVSLRSFAVAADPKFPDGYSWNGVLNHFVVVTRVPAKLADHEWGFTFEFVDPQTARTESAYVYLERERPFVAAKGNDSKYEWKDGSPFLLVTAPTLPLATNRQTWWSRTIITLNYAITLQTLDEPAKKP